MLRVFRDSPFLNSKSKNSKLVALLLDWFSRYARDLPWRRTRDPYAIWVSEIMLQQTQVKTVIPYWERWMRALPTIESVAKANSAKLHKLWEGLGYYSRVRNLRRAAQIVVSNHGGKFPDRFDDILSLPGIGRYTAGAICSIAFNQPKPILDGNVIRVLTRVFGIHVDPREKRTNVQLWQLAEELVNAASEQEYTVLKKSRAESPPLVGVAMDIRPPVSMENQRPPLTPSLSPSDGERVSAGRVRGIPRVERAGVRASDKTISENSCSFLNQSLMELGALVCTPRSPNCPTCPVQKLCSARKESLQDQLPNLAKRAATTIRRFIAFVVERNGKLLVRQRPAGVVNAHLWEFPNLEIRARLCEPQQVRRAARGLELNLLSLKPLCTIKHSITRYRITLEARRAILASTANKIPGRWLTSVQLRKLAFTSAHKKILNCIREDS